MSRDLLLSLDAAQCVQWSRNPSFAASIIFCLEFRMAAIDSPARIGGSICHLFFPSQIFFAVGRQQWRISGEDKLLAGVVPQSCIARRIKRA